MVAPWNPNAPSILGLEWRPVLPTQWGPTLTPVVQRHRSRSAETITGLRWSVRGATTRDQHMMIVDIYLNGDEILAGTSGLVRQVEYSPNADTFNGGWFRRVDGLTTNLFQKINENPVTYPAVRTDLGIYTQTGIPTEYRCRVASGAFSLTARVLKLEAVYVVAAAGYEWRDTDFRIYWAGAGGPLVYNIPGSHVTTHYYGKLITLDLGEINPVTLAPWTPADVRAFSTASGFELRAEGVGNPVSPVNLVSLSLRVTYQDTENRKAAAIWRRPAVDFSIPRAIDTDRIVTLPGGTANWAKATATDYTFVHRLAQDPLVQYVSPRANDILLEQMTDPGPRLRLLNQPRMPSEMNFADVPIPGMAAAVATLDQWNRVVMFNGSTDTVKDTLQQGNGGLSPTRLFQMLLLKAAGVVSEDSQPYGSAGGQLIIGSNRVYTGMSQFQEMVPGATQSYLGVDFICCEPDNTESTLTVQVTTTAGGAVGGSFTITRANAALLEDLYPPARIRRVRGWLSTGASLTSGTTYRVTFSSNAPNDAEGWKIGTAGAPDSLYTAAGVAAPLGGLATFQASTARGTYKGTADSGIDLMVVLIAQPSAPVATAAITSITDESPTFSRAFCDPATFELPKITWTAGAYTNFARWEVEREEADLLGYWVPLVYITNESQKLYRDYGARRNVAARYRVRALLTTGAFTDWATTTQVIPRPKRAEVVLASDAEPSLTAAVDRHPSVRYQFLSPEEDTFVTMAGVPYQTVFGTPVERGVRFEYEVIVSVVDDLPEKGVAAFKALRELMTSPEIPYVIVLDHDGNRFYAHVQMGSGLHTEPGHHYTTTLIVTEITDTPVVVVQP